MFNMDVEEMPIHHLKENLTKEEIEEVILYRRHDVMATFKLLELTLGLDINVPELSFYIGKNKIEDRLNIIEETGMKCLNWNDVKIGEEWNKLDYMKEENISNERDLFPKKIIYPFGKKFKQYFPKSTNFQTDNLKNFIEDFGNQYIKNEKQEFKVKIGSTTYTVAKGGLHSTEKHRKIIVEDGYRYDDQDIGSQYPNSIVKLGICPPHLKKTIFRQYSEKIEKRIKFKKLSKETKGEESKKYGSIQEMLKLALNGGYYGKLGQKGSFLEYPEGMLKVSIANQIEILMLIESLELEGFNVLSGNTDGISVYYSENKRNRFKEICKEWEEKIGNDIMGKLEETPFRTVWQESINHYIALKEDGSIKKKGRFSTDFELNKNKSMRIIPLALEAYFVRGENPIEYIKNHKNIYDFCVGVKTSGKMYYEEEWKDGDQIKVRTHKKLVVFYISNEGNILYKRGLNYKGKPINNHVNAPTELGQPKITYFNRKFKADNYNIDYNHYILITLKRIDEIEKTKKAKDFVDSCIPSKQLSIW